LDEKLTEPFFRRKDFQWALTVLQASIIAPRGLLRVSVTGEDNPIMWGTRHGFTLCVAIRGEGGRGLSYNHENITFQTDLRGGWGV
jgi:hypothetical protein